MVCFRASPCGIGGGDLTVAWNAPCSPALASLASRKTSRGRRSWAQCLVFDGQMGVLHTTSDAGRMRLNRHRMLGGMRVDGPTYATADAVCDVVWPTTPSILPAWHGIEPCILQRLLRRKVATVPHGGSS